MSQVRKPEIEDDDSDSGLSLPYDPEEWERRLNVARERRSAVLARRLTEMRTAQEGAAVLLTTEAPSRPVDAAAPESHDLAQVPPRREQRQAAIPAPVTEPDAATPDRGARWIPHRLRPVAAAFALGLAVGLPLSVPDLFGRPADPVQRAPQAPLSAVPPALGPPVSLPDPALALSLQAPNTAAMQATEPETAPIQLTNPSPALTIAAEPSEPVPAMPATTVVPVPDMSVPVAAPVDADPVQAAPESLLAPPHTADAQDPLPAPPSIVADDGPASPPPADILPDAIDPPGALPIHVFVPGAVATDRIAAVADLLREAGVTANTPTRARFSISETNVRFYHIEDAARAGKIAEALEADARDFTDFRPSPPPGLIEVWLAGKAPSRSAGGRAKGHQDDRPGLLKALSLLLSGQTRNEPR